MLYQAKICFHMDKLIRATGDLVTQESHSPGYCGVQYVEDNKQNNEEQKTAETEAAYNGSPLWSISVWL